MAMDDSQSLISQMQELDGRDRSDAWSDLYGWLFVLEGYVEDALADTKDEALARLASDVSEDSLYNLMNGRPYSELSYRKENSGLTAIDGYGTIEEGGYNGRTEVREGQLYEGGALRASESGSDEERTTTIRPDGVSEVALDEGENLDGDRRLGDGRVRLRGLIKTIDEKADYVPMQELARTVDDASRFHDAIGKSRETNKYGLHGSLYHLDTIDHDGWTETGYTDPSMRLFLSDDEKEVSHHTAFIQKDRETRGSPQHASILAGITSGNKNYTSNGVYKYKN